MNNMVMDAYDVTDTQMTVNQWIPKTRQEIVRMCEKNPDNPVAKDLMIAVENYPDGTVSYVLPISIQAVEENRTVLVEWNMRQVKSPATGKMEYKRVKSLKLGPVLENEGGDNE